MSAAGRRQRRGAFWAAVVVAVLAVAGGGAVAASGSMANSDPSSVVRAYFTALVHADAPAALALGPVPSGSRTLLSSAALRAQQQTAPIRDVTVVPATTRGPSASVRVRYHLAFASGDVAVASTIALRRHGGVWQLDRSALVTTPALSSSSQRATLLGGTVPTQPVPMFPGAVPIEFDSPYLQVLPATDSLAFGATDAQLEVAITAAGRRAMTAAVLGALRACLTGFAAAASATCPEPDERVIPGSVRGRISGPLQHANLVLSPDAVGQFGLSATVPTQVTYQRLDFRNSLRAHTGHELIALHAVGYAVAPIQLRWAR